MTNNDYILWVQGSSVSDTRIFVENGQPFADNEKFTLLSVHQGFREISTGSASTRLFIRHQSGFKDFVIHGHFQQTDVVGRKRAFMMYIPSVRNSSELMARVTEVAKSQHFDLDSTLPNFFEAQKRREKYNKIAVLIAAAIAGIILIAVLTK